MRCPYLEESPAAWCAAASPPRILLRSVRPVSGCTCVSPAWRRCATARSVEDEAPEGAERCPALRAGTVRYCAATLLPKLLPGAGVMPSLCERDTHRRCPAYPRSAREGRGTAGAATDGRPGQVPAGLRLTRNHLWIDLGADGSCNIGVDGFVAAALGHVECVWFVTRSGRQQPTAVLSLGRVGIPFVFPCRLNIVRTNAQLRRAPRLVVADAYGDGWLFEAACAGESTLAGLDGLLAGGAAESWLAAETQRLERFVAERFPAAPGPTGLARSLAPDEIIELAGEFFPTAEAGQAGLARAGGAALAGEAG